MMKKISSCFNASIILFLILMTTGCEHFPHAMQPAQLRKLNRGPALGRDTYNFSIKDPVLPAQKEEDDFIDLNGNVTRSAI